MKLHDCPPLTGHSDSATKRLDVEIEVREVGLKEYMDVVRNMARDPIFSAEEREILTIALEDTEEWLSGEGNEILKSDCESQLDLLHVVCDPYITRHREAIEAKESRSALLRYIASLKTMLSGHHHLEDEQVEVVYGVLIEIDVWLSMVDQDEQAIEAIYASQLDQLRAICDPFIKENAERGSIHHGGQHRFGGPGEEVERLRETAKHMPHNSPGRIDLLITLADLFLGRYAQLGELKDMQEAITWGSELVEATPHYDPFRPRRIANLGALLLGRFKTSGKVEDSDDAIRWLREAVNLVSYDNPDRPSFLKNIGITFRCRFEYFGDIADLNMAIEYLRESVFTTSSNNLARADRLDTLALSLYARSEKFGSLDDIKETISCLQEAVQLTPHDTPNRSVYLNRLGLSIRLRFKLLKEEKDTEEAIAKLRQAVHATSYNISHRPTCLSDLGAACLDRFKQSQDKEHVDEAIERLSEAEKLIPCNSPIRIDVVNILGNSYQSRYLQFGSVEDMEASIKWLSEVVKGTLPHHPDRPRRLNNLSASLLRRFQKFEKITDNEDSITALEEAIELISHNNPDRPSFLHNLGNAFRNRYQSTDNIDDISKSIKTLQESVKLTSYDHPTRPIRLSILCLSLQARFQKLNIVEDIEEAIGWQREAVEFTPSGSPDRASRLINLTTYLKGRFKLLREAKDIDEAIKVVRVALDATSHQSLDRASYLDDLSDSFHLRFKRFGVGSDDEEAITASREAVKLTLDGDPRLLGRLNDLSTLCQFHFSRLGDFKDINEAIEISRRVVAFTPHDNPRGITRAYCLDNLGSALMYRFSRLGIVTDIDEAIEMHKEAIKLEDDETGFLNSLGFALHLRFLHSERIEDIDESIQALRQAEGKMPESNVNRSKLLFNFGMALLSRYEHNANSQDYHDAISVLRSSSMLLTGSPAGRFDASFSWARAAHTAKDLASAFEGYTQAIHLLAQVVWIGLSVTARLEWLSKIQALACNAAACAFERCVLEPEFQQQHLGHAIELLDRGRSLLWSQMSNMKSDFGELSRDHPELAKELADVGHALDQGSFRASNQAPITEQEGQVLRRRAEEWEKLVARIRRLPGHSYFLLPPPISELRKAATGGSIVVINISTYRCDAVIIRTDGDLVLVPLSGVTAEQLGNLVKDLSKKVKAFENSIDPASFHDELKNVLHDTWTLLGYPIISSFEVPTGSPPPRVWWCLTGLLTFIPIHASLPRPLPRARRRAKGMMDRVISSYTPTLSALLRAKRRQNAPPLRMLAVGVPEGFAPYLPLPSVATEMEIINNRLPAEQLQSIMGDNATVESVSEALKHCTWAHFGCHGIEDPMEPMNSFLVMSNGRLTLSMIARNSLHEAEFAYLSACQTARGPIHLPDEAIHLAAGMQYAGFRGIIGTLWSIADDTAHTMTERVYTKLFKNDTTQSNAEEAANALNEAVRYLRDEAQVPLSQWVPFIHIGL